MTKTNDDGRRRGNLLLEDGGVEAKSEVGAEPAVLTMGMALDEEPGTGRMMTSTPSKVSPLSLEFNSVSALTGSALTMTGYKAEHSNRT
mgnify:FL=1